jgi:hypothetical protein
MARPRRETLRALTGEEEQLLERTAQARDERMDRVGRAVALLAVAHGQTYTQAARQAGWRTHVAVAKLVRRFNQRGLGALDIAAGRGRHSTYDHVARAQIVAVAQQEPDQRTDQAASSSLSTLERRLRQEGLPRVSATTIRRVLLEAEVRSSGRISCPTGSASRKRPSGGSAVEGSPDGGKNA